MHDSNYRTRWQEPAADDVAASARTPQPASWLIPSLIIGVVALVAGLAAGATTVAPFGADSFSGSPDTGHVARR